MDTINSRVVADLKMILMLLQQDRLQEKKIIVRDTLKQAEDRITTIMLFHEHLQKAANKTTIQTDLFITDLVNYLVATSEKPNTTIKLKIGDDIQLDLKTMLWIGIMINEVITNTLEHSIATNNTSNFIEITFLQQQQRLKLSIQDNGTLKTGYASKNVPKTFGFQLIQLMVDQMGGQQKLTHKSKITHWEFTTDNEPRKSGETGLLKDMPAPELHHLIKNNLQLIHSLLILHANSESRNNVKKTLQMIHGRVQVVTLIFTYLFRSSTTQSCINVLPFFEELIARIHIQLKTTNETTLKIADLKMNANEVLILGLITHTFATLFIGAKSQGTILINLKMKNSDCFFNLKYIHNKSSAKLILLPPSNIITELAKQLDGTTDHYQNKQETAFNIRFKKDNYSPVS